MDNHTQQNLDALTVELKNMGTSINDPVSKLMAVTLLHQIQKIKDEINALPTRIIERLCNTFVPKDKIDAIPSIAFVQPSVKAKRDITPHLITDGSFFT